MSGFRDLTLYVVRHGETQDNVAGIVTAQSDSPLTARGRAQARAKGPILRELVPDLEGLAFIASPLHRACVTMELLREAAGLAPQAYVTDHRLQEIDFGDWTKLPEAGRGTEVHRSWTLVCPRGESEAMLHERVGRFLETVKRDSAIVCHARVVSMIRGHALGLSPEETMEYEPSNAGGLRLTRGSETFLSD